MTLYNSSKMIEFIIDNIDEDKIRTVTKDFTK